MSEVELRDAIIRHALQLQRLSAGQEAEVEQILAELERELRALLNSQALSEASRAEINDLIRQAEEAIRPSYARAAAATDTRSIALIVAERTVEAMEDAFPVNVIAPTPERLASLTKDVLIDGAPSSAWWERQAEDTAFKFAAEVRKGVVNGDTNERIVARIAGTRTEPGIMAIARRNARALVHSSIMSAANQARLATFRKNARLLGGVRYLATLDSHTCLRCAAHDGATWNLDGEPIKGTRIAFDPPPLHFSCRCVLSPVPKGLSEFGIEAPAGERASAEGTISATTSFDEFLKRNRIFAEKILGKRRAEMFLAGKLTLTDFVTGGGAVLTLDDL